MSNIPNRTARLFRISDVRALENCRTVHGLMNGGDLADFAAFDPTFTQPWLDDWATELDTAESFKTDETYRDEMQGKTDGVAALMQDARKAYRVLKHFVQKAFPDDRAVQHEFGFDDYDDARQSDTKLHQFMLTLYNVATKYTTQITDPAVGYPAASIAQLQTLANNLLSTNIDQEIHKKEQVKTTQDRINALNAPWKRRQLVSSAAKLVYDDNYAKYQQYLPPASEGNPDDYAILGKITDQATNQAIADAVVSIGALGISISSDDLGNYGIADNMPPANYEMEVSKDGYQSQIIQVSISSADETITVNVKLEAE